MCFGVNLDQVRCDDGGISHLQESCDELCEREKKDLGKGCGNDGKNDDYKYQKIDEKREKGDEEDD